MKKVMCSILSLTLICTMAAPAFAASNLDNASAGHIATEISTDSLDDCKQLTFEEVIAQDMEYYNISYEEARNQLLAKEAEILARHYGNSATMALMEHSNLLEYYTYQKEFSYDLNTAFKGLMTARIVVMNDYGVHKVIESVDSITSKRTAGLYRDRWIQQSATSRIATDYKSVRIEIVGYFEVEVDASVEGSVTIAGFTGGGSIGGTFIYESEPVIKNWTYKVS